MKHLVLAILLCVSCGGEPPAETPPVDAATLPDVAYTLHFGPFPVPAGKEGVVCLDVPGPAEDVWVSGWHTVSKFIHHTNVFARTSGTPFAVPTECAGGANLGDPFFGSRQSDEVVRLGAAPEYANVSRRLPASTGLLWDVHYLNTTAKTGEATVDVEFYDAPDHSRPINNFHFNGGTDMSIAPGAQKTLTFTCPGPEADVVVLSASAHVHAHNTAATLSFGGEEVYRSTDWAEPPVKRFDSLGGNLLVVPAGAGASWSCEIKNTTSVTLKYSNEVQTGEMCILSGFTLGPAWKCARP